MEKYKKNKNRCSKKTAERSQSLNKYLIFSLFFILLPNGCTARYTHRGRHAIDVSEVPEIRDFQKIGDGEDKLFVYSAYFDEYRGASDPGSVRVMGGLKTDFAKPLYCQFYDEEGIHYSTVAAKVRAISENFGFKYSASFVTCELLEFTMLPSYVSIVESARSIIRYADNVLKIKYPEDNNLERKYKFAVCVQPTYKYEEPLRFVEWMEFHRMMGVEKFTFYNVSIGPQTSCLLQSYGNEVEVLPWSSEYEPEDEIRMYSQFIAANDCIYRYRGVADYVIYVDLDEMIIPNYGANYTQFFQFLHRELRDRMKFTDDIASYNFRNGFFFDSWDDDYKLGEPSSTKMKGNLKATNIFKELQMSKKIWRTREMEDHDDRSKLIVVPEKVVEIGNHAVFEASGYAKRIAVPAELAYTHHYRICIYDYCETKLKMAERSAQRYTEDVALQVTERIYSIAEKCNLESDIEKSFSNYLEDDVDNNDKANNEDRGEQTANDNDALFPQDLPSILNASYNIWSGPLFSYPNLFQSPLEPVSPAKDLLNVSNTSPLDQSNGISLADPDLHQNYSMLQDHVNSQTENSFPSLRTEPNVSKEPKNSKTVDLETDANSSGENLNDAQLSQVGYNVPDSDNAENISEGKL